MTGRLTIVTCLLLAAATEADAGKPPPGIQHVPLPVHAPTDAPCTLGHNAAEAHVVDYILPPNDSFYTLLPRGVCDGGGAYSADVAHARIYFRAICAQPLEVAIVGATGESCLVPDSSEILCGPFAFEYTPASIGSHDITIALGSCSISGDAFLRVTFVAQGEGCSTAATAPSLVTSNQCVDCASYNSYPGGVMGDLCRLLLPGRPIMYVESKAVPVQARTWGALKLRYR